MTPNTVSRVDPKHPSGSTTNRLQWNARNQLTNMTGSATATFVYDGLGRRITRTVSGGTEKYLYDGLDIILQKDSANAVRCRYFRGLAIDEPWQRIDVGTTNTNRVYLADALGSIVALTDTGKVIRTEYDYEPFGATTTTGQANRNAYKFTAREDDGTGLYYYRARYYHPVLGRFISEDPLGQHGGINVYVYVWDMPLRGVDPFGLYLMSADFWAALPGAMCSTFSNGEAFDSVSGAVWQMANVTTLGLLDTGVSTVGAYMGMSISIQPLYGNQAAFCMGKGVGTVWGEANWWILSYYGGRGLGRGNLRWSNVPQKYWGGGYPEFQGLLAMGMTSSLISPYAQALLTAQQLDPGEAATVSGFWFDIHVSGSTEPGFADFRCTLH